MRKKGHGARNSAQQSKQCVTVWTSCFMEKERVLQVGTRSDRAEFSFLRLQDDLRSTVSSQKEK